MGKIDFVPKRAADLDLLEKQFLENVDTVAGLLALTPDSVTKVKDLINLHQSTFSERNSAEQNFRTAVDKNKQAEQNALSSKGGLREFANYVKSQPNYTTDMGIQLGIEGSDSIINYADLKPVLNVVYEGMNITIKFKKQGTDGIKIFSRRGSETEFTFLATDTESPYVDNRPKLNSAGPELREYQAVYLIRDDAVGQTSDIVKFTLI
jgi:hypothetical protein